MLPLMEMMLKSQNGEAFSQIQQQFGLDSQQAEQALQAVLPAFSAGLKRNTTQPRDFGAFMQALSEGQHEKYVDDSNSAFSQKGVKEGNSILGHLFGSKQASREIASHASKASGLGESLIKKMLPVVASMVMGGIAKQATGQAQNFGASQNNKSANAQPANAMGGGILGQILGELVKGGLSKAQAPRGRNRQGNNPIGDILDQMMGGGARNQTPNNSPMGRDNPLGQIFEEMLQGKRGNYQPEEQDDNDYQRQPRQRETRQPRQRQPRQNEPQYREPEYRDSDDDFEDIGGSERYQPSETRQPRAQKRKRGNGFDDLFGDMFETGRDVDEGYQRGVESIFDKFMKR